MGTLNKAHVLDLWTGISLIFWSPFYLHVCIIIHVYYVVVFLMSETFHISVDLKFEAQEWDQQWWQWPQGKLIDHQ